MANVLDIPPLNDKEKSIARLFLAESILNNKLSIHFDDETFKFVIGLDMLTSLTISDLLIILNRTAHKDELNISTRYYVTSLINSFENLDWLKSICYGQDNKTVFHLFSKID